MQMFWIVALFLYLIAIILELTCSEILKFILLNIFMLYHFIIVLFVNAMSRKSLSDQVKNSDWCHIIISDKELFLHDSNFLNFLKFRVISNNQLKTAFDISNVFICIKKSYVKQFIIKTKKLLNVRDSQWQILSKLTVDILELFS